MPPPAPVFVDVAARFRPASMSVSISMPGESTTATSTTAPPAANPRLPSNRPIDHRWDRSRGIVFSNAKARTPLSHDQNWSHANAISFAPFSTAARHDAVTRLRARSPPVQTPPDGKPKLSESGKPKIGESSSAPSFNHAFKGQTQGMSQQDVEGIKQDNREKAKNIDALKKRDQDKEQKLAEQNETIRALEKKLQAMVETMKNDKEVAVRGAKRAPARNYEEKMQKDRTLNESKMTKLKEQHEAKQAEQECFYKEELQRDPRYTAIVADMCKKDEQREAARLDEQALHRDSQEQLQRSMDYLDQQKERFAREHQRQTDELDAKIAETEESERRSVEKLNERAQRGERDRTGYTTYRNLFDNFVEDFHPVLELHSKAQRDMQTDADRWRKDESRFVEWKTNDYKLFDHVSKYKVKGKAVIEFIQEAASQADAARGDSNELFTALHSGLHEMKSLAHESRQLTRTLHFSPEQTIYDTTRTAHRTTVTDYLVDHVSECKQQMDKIEETIESTKDSTAQVHLRAEWATWRDRRSLIMKISAIADHLNEIAALEALLHDSTVEKIVYLETRQNKRAIGAVVNDHRDLRNDIPGLHQERQKHIREFIENERAASSSIDDLESLTRNQAIIDLETGEMNEETERKRVDAMIEARIAEERKALEADFGMLLPALKKPTTMRERKQQAQIQATSMASLRRSLDQTVAASPSRSGFGALARPVLPNSKRVVSVEFYERELKNLIKAKAKILDPVDGDLDKLDKASKSKLAGVNINYSVVKRKLQERRAETKSHNTGNASAEPSQSGTTKTKQKTAEATTKNQSTNGTQKTKKETRRARMRIRYSYPLTRHAAVMKDIPPSTSAPSSAKGALNITPTQPKQAYDSRPPHHFYPAAASATCVDAEAPMSWVELSEEAKMRSLRGLATASDGAECHMGSPSSHDPSDGSQSSYQASAASSSENSSPDTASAGRKSNDDAADSQPNTAAAEPQMALTYEISAKDYRIAATASPSSGGAYWSHKLYKGAEGTSPKVMYCTSFDTAEKQAKEFLSEKVLGFDLEWEPKSSLANGTIKRNLSLIQIASENKIGLFQIALFKGETAAELMPPTLRKMLESPDVIKTGVNVSGDMKRMKACLDVEMQGVLELSHLYRLVMFSGDQPNLVSFKLVSLADQVQNVLLLPLKKDDNRMSSWSRSLNVEQTNYAAADAYAGFHLYHKLEKMRKEMKPTPPRPAFFETFKPIILGNGDVVERSAKRTAAVKRPVAEAEAEEGEEDEEFFDAREELDTYELASSSSDPSKSDSAAGVPQSAGESDEVAYPTLPQVSEETPSVAGLEEQSPTIPIPTLSAEPPRSTNRPTTAATTLAETWTATYLLTHPKARPSNLRAHHLWHEQNFPLQAVAAALRDPPLQLTTVASYVLEAIKIENLPYDVQRVRKVLEVLPRSVWGRYRGIVERVRRAERERGRDL